jgi:hypothetical protein
MLAADALWPHDEQQARAIFRRAWEAATAADKAEHEDSLSKELGLTDSVRESLLETVAARDAKLANEFLRDISKESSEERSSNQSPQSTHDAWRRLSADGERRLSIASTLLRQGEAHRAAEIAAPVINEGVNESLVEFILDLRERDVDDADALYMRLLEHAAADPQTDANDVLLLSSPIVSPYLLVKVDEFGSLKFQAFGYPSANSPTQQAVPQQAQVAFFNLAASILLRSRVSNDEAITMQELVASFYTTGRLLPFFENSSASYVSYAPALRARQSELFNVMEAARREQVSAQFGVSSLTRTGNVDPLRSQQEELARADTSIERERIALAMIQKAVRLRFWDRARRAASEIEDQDKRRAALSFIQVHQIKAISRDYADEKEDDFESVVKFVRGADVPPFAKAWGFAQAAAIAARKRGPETTQIVAELINEAESYAERAEQGTPERVAAYGVVTMTAARFDQERAWSLLREYVKSANAVEDFTGDETSLDLAANAGAGDEAEQFSVEAEVFRLDGIFATMAHLDFDKALTEARALDADVPQALATIAVAKTRIQKSEVRSQNEKQNP